MRFGLSKKQIIDLNNELFEVEMMLPIHPKTAKALLKYIRFNLRKKYGIN